MNTLTNAHPLMVPNYVAAEFESQLDKYATYKSEKTTGIWSKIKQMFGMTPNSLFSSTKRNYEILKLLRFGLDNQFFYTNNVDRALKNLKNSLNPQTQTFLIEYINSIISLGSESRYQFMGNVKASIDLSDAIHEKIKSIYRSNLKLFKSNAVPANNSNFQYLQFLQGCLQAENGEFDKGIRTILEAIKPGSSKELEGNFKINLSLGMLNHIDAARPWILKLIKIFYNQIHVEIQKGNFERADFLFHRARSLEVGASMYLRGNYYESNGILKANREICAKMAQKYHLDNNYDKAIYYYETALEIRRSNDLIDRSEYNQLASKYIDLMFDKRDFLKNQKGSEKELELHTYRMSNGFVWQSDSAVNHLLQKIDQLRAKNNI